MSGKKEKPVMIITHDWLRELEIGTKFLALGKELGNIYPTEYEVVHKLENCICLKSKHYNDCWVHSFRWSQQYILADILQEEKEYVHRGTV